MRIHELAKELGVDNKVVLAMAQELGMRGKSSHSNSLDPAETDQIRRAIIRNALGTAPNSEVVTTRVDKSTGQTNTVVESRKGNVIRRRKQEVTTPVESLASEAAVEDSSERAGAVEREALDQGSASRNGDHEANLSDDQSSVVVAELTESQSAEVDERVEPEDEGKKGAGPRVLGKIDLPLKRTAKPEVRRAPALKAVESVVGEIDDEEAKERERLKKLESKKRTRKREFSRTDLVDYEGKDRRRTGRSASKEVLNRKDTPKEVGEDGQDVSKPKLAKREVKISEAISVGDLAKQMSLKVGEVIAKLMQLGVMATINQPIDFETASVIAEEFGFIVQSTSFDETKLMEADVIDEVDKLQSRAPVVTVMGHVDHGKTSLLDKIRQTSVVDKEHGGITQHIGAYSTVLEDGRSITFIDTPGHAAFTSMRVRGAQVTDIVILVVAADDGVMPQTLEALNHAKAAKVPIIVAVNKIDKPGVNPEKIKQQLAERGLAPEEWGGDTMYFHVSALKGTGIKELLEGVLLLAEVKELKANPDRLAKGTLIEAKQERGRGTVGTVLVQNGSLRVGDMFVSGCTWGSVRSMSDYRGKRIELAGPSSPVEITGFEEVPMSGDDFFVVDSEAKAREISSNRAQKRADKERLASKGGLISLEEFARRANAAEYAELNILVKADVHGSVEAVRESLQAIPSQKVNLKILHAAVGAINESDVQLARASKAIILGFGVRAEPRALAEAESSGVELRFYRIIYELIDDVKKAMAGLLKPVRQEVNLGRVEVRQVFNVGKNGTIAGSYVVDGLIRRTANLRLLRDGRVVFEGKPGSLKRFKDDVREVQSGYECGISIEGFNDIKTGDVIEVFEYKETPAVLE